MLNYRNTPPQGHTHSPAQRMFLRRTRTTLPTTDQLLAPAMINFRIVEEEILKKRRDSKAHYDKSAIVEQRPINIGNYAYAKPPPRHRGNPWGSDKERQCSVIHNPYTSRQHHPTEQSPAETCSTTTNLNLPTTGGSHSRHRRYKNSLNTLAGYPQTTTSHPGPPHTINASQPTDPQGTARSSRGNTGTVTGTSKTPKPQPEPNEADKIWEGNQTPRKTERLCHTLGILLNIVYEHYQEFCSRIVY